jgi:hypothetical protein
VIHDAALKEITPQKKRREILHLVQDDTKVELQKKITNSERSEGPALRIFLPKGSQRYAVCDYRWDPSLRSG